MDAMSSVFIECLLEWIDQACVPGYRNPRARRACAFGHARCPDTTMKQPPSRAKGRRHDVRKTPGAMPLPHERDESSGDPARPTRVMQTAHDDLKQGRVDTDDRGTRAKRAFDQASSHPRKNARSRP